MGKSLVTETPDELTGSAEIDIMAVDSLFTKPKYPVDRMYNIICNHATQAVEKLLKGYIISNGKEIEKMHNLDNLCKVAIEIDDSFKEIAGDCVFLNTYTPDIKYTNKNEITNYDMTTILKSLKIICNFPPLKAMRDLFSKKYNYEIVTEVYTEPAHEATDQN